MERNQLLIIGLEGLTAHKVRSVLTMLGVIFGVGAVIAMLSVGEGAKQEALEKFKTLGVNNIIVRDKNLSEKELEEVRAKFSQGLNLKDAQAIQSIVPSVETLAPQSELESEAKFQDKSVKVTLVGVTPEFRELLNYFPDRGEFLTEDHYNRDMRVCILGAEVAKSLFPIGNPIGQQVKLHDQWFEVIGTMGVKTLFTETVGELAARNLNQDVYIPLTALLRRFTKEEQLDSQLDQLTLRVRESSELMESAAIIRRIMSRRHFGNDDFDLVIPYELLLQEEKERRIYNMVLGSIAAISLLVGGIGIMNIMLATVLERTREIGVRRALGATRKDILMQFLIEAVGLSLVGGLIGVTLGVSMSWIIDAIAEFQTIVSTVSVLVAFVVSGTVGVVAGTVPAKRAAAINPIDALRFE
jgi:putative ABC transport system permease protein